MHVCVYRCVCVYVCVVVVENWRKAGDQTQVRPFITLSPECINANKLNMKLRTICLHECAGEHK